MTWTRWSLVVLGLVFGSESVRAQSIAYYNPYVYDYSTSALSYRHQRGQNAVAVSVGGFAVQGLGVAPLYGPFGGIAFPRIVAPYYAPIVTQQVTVVNYRPPAVVLPAPFIADDLTRAILPRPEPEIPLNPRPLPERAKPEVLPAKPPEAVKPPQPKPADPPRIPHPKLEPRAENARLIALGKESFADLEYGRAAQRFRQATLVFPNDGQAHFLLAQALFALGKYQDAVEAISTGMDLQPTWPSSKFQPLEMYGENVAFYPEHLQRLDEVVQRNPNDADVLFLYAYQLWFDGRKDEARVWLQKALALGADAGVIDRFLRALPEGAGI